MNSSKDNNTKSALTPQAMSTPVLPSTGQKRHTHSASADESPSKRIRTHAEDKPHSSPKRKLVPVISRAQTSPQHQLLKELSDAAIGPGRDKALSNEVNENVLPNSSRSEDMELPSSCMMDQGDEDGLFSALDSMDSHALTEDHLFDSAGLETEDEKEDVIQDEDDVLDDLPKMDNSQIPKLPEKASNDEVAGEQKGIEDGDDTFELNTDGLPKIDDPQIRKLPEKTSNDRVTRDLEGVEDANAAFELDGDGLPKMDKPQIPKLPEQTYSVEAGGGEQVEKTRDMVPDLNEDRRKCADLEALIPGISSYRSSRSPMEPQMETAESSGVAHAAAHPPQTSHAQDSHGVHQLVTQDEQVDQFIVETGATLEEETEQAANIPLNAEAVISSTSPATQNNHEPDLQIIDPNISTLPRYFKPQGFKYTDQSRRPATPPIPSLPTSSDQPETASSVRAYNVNKTAASTAVLRAQELNGGLSGPVAGRDHCQILNNYQAFYQKVIHLVPELPNWKAFPWSRRYWIAVLYSHKKPRAIARARDFMWMKGELHKKRAQTPLFFLSPPLFSFLTNTPPTGNKYTTISTIWHSYALRTLEEDFALTCRGEVLDMKDQAGELDWFNQKFVVLRAISTSNSSTSTSTSTEKSRMRSRMPPGLVAGIGIVPPLEGEVVVIDGEDGEGEGGGKGGKDKKMKEVLVID